MGTTLTGKRVQNTYDSLLKIGDNDNLTGTAKRIGDGLGNDSPIFLSTTKIGIGVTPTYEFQTNSHAKIGGNLIVGGNLTVNGTTTIIDSTVIAIGDNMMEMAKDNVSNTMDIGWYGTINESGEKYVGVFYDASSGVTTPEFHIGLGTVEPSSTASWTTKGKLVIGALDATTGVFSGQVTIPATPSASTDAASKGYVDSSISSGSVEVAKRIEITVKNISGGSLSKGTIVHASPSVSPPSGNVVEVIAADYDDATKMPGIGVLNEAIANEAEGAAVMIGAVSGINTSSFSAGDELFVGNNGAFTNTKPTANNELIQKIAIVLKVHASNGSIKVFGAGRANDVPNQISRNVNFTDNSKLTFGDSTTPDFQIYHDGNNSYINEDGTGVLAIQSNGTEVQINKGTTEYMARFITDGAVNLYYDNSKKFETTSGGILVTGDINLTGTAIYKNSGDLEIKAQTIRIKGVTTNENLAGFTENGSVELYYDNSKKFETTSGGISVTGLGQFSNKILVADGSVSAPSYSFTSDTDTGFYIDGASIKLAIGGSNKVTFAGSQTTIEETLFVNDYISADDKVIIEGENAYLQIQDVSQETYTSLYSLDAESVLSYTHGAFSLRTGFFDGTVVFSVDSSRNVTFNNNVLPDVDSANDLGSTSLRWANVWADNINGGTPVNGGGTPNDVVMWSDGDTLTDAPIAISGNNATFAGSVTATSLSDGFITMAFAQINRDGAAVELQYTPSNTATLVRIGGNGSNPTIFNAHSGDATFTGQIEVSKASNQIKLSTGTAGDGYLNIGHFANGTFIGTYGDDGGAADLLRFGVHSGDVALRINSDKSATFTGDVTLGDTSSDHRSLSIQTNSEKNSVINLKEGSNLYGFSLGYYGVANDFIIKRHDNSSSGTDVLTLNRDDNNATFAGNIRTGTSTLTANTNFDNLVIEGSSHTGITIFSGASSDGGIYFGDSDANNLGQIKYLHSSNAMTFATNDGSPTLTLDSSTNATFAGSVGIATGTSSLSYKLQVNGTGYINETLYVNGATTVDDNFFVTNGSAGIGTSSIFSGNRLDVRGGNIMVGGFGGGTDYGLILTPDDGSGYWNIANVTGGALTFNNSATIGSSEQMRLTTTGLGIGTTPSTKLHILGGDSAIRITPTGSNDPRIDFTDSGGTVRFYTGYDVSSGNFVITSDEGGFGSSNIMVMSDAGNVGIGGVTSPSNKLHVYNTASADVALLESTQVFSTLAFKSSTNSSTVTVGIDGAGNAAFENKLSSGNMRFVTNGSERMRLTSDGDILLGGITSVGNTHASFDSASNDRMIFNIGSSTTSSVDIINFRNPNGIVGGINTDGFTTSFSSSSDYRLKENVVKLTNALDKVSELKPSRFNFINEQKTVNGFLAHEVENIVPEAISGTKDQVDDKGNPIYQRIDQSKLVPLLVGAIQELKEEIEILRSQINS
jgi:hypothetical protein